MNIIPYRIIQAVLGIMLIVLLSACGLFRGGCKCPPVHRKSASHNTTGLYGLGDGNGAHLSRSARQ